MWQIKTFVVEGNGRHHCFGTPLRDAGVPENFPFQSAFLQPSNTQETHFHPALPVIDREYVGFRCS